MFHACNANSGRRASGVTVGLHRSEHLTTSSPSTRTEDLRNAFLFTVDALKRRRADLISEALITDYVNLYWLEWNGGSLQLTVTGRNMCEQIRAAKA